MAAAIELVKVELLANFVFKLVRLAAPVVTELIFLHILLTLFVTIALEVRVTHC